jgi:hypothetical protein
MAASVRPFVAVYVDPEDLEAVRVRYSTGIDIASETEPWRLLDVVLETEHLHVLTIRLLLIRRNGELQGRCAQNVYNITGSHATVNLQSEAGHSIEQLRDALQQMPDERKKLAILGELETMCSAEKAADRADGFRRFISLAADCMTIVSPFFPVLIELLANGS